VSREIVRRIHRRIPLSTTRDGITKSILHRSGVTNVINTGCPSLFDLDKVKARTPIKKPVEIERIGVSMAQNSILHPQNVLLMRSIVRLFPNSQRLAFFHRGINPDQYTSVEEGQSLQRLVAYARSMGYEIVDLAYEVEKMSLYEQMDIHIGYRVHAHAHSTCKRIPSFLLWEDGRGQGMSLNLGIEGVRALRTRFLDRVSLPGSARKYIRAARGRLPFMDTIDVNPDAIPRVMHVLSREINNGFRMFDPVPDRIAHLYSRLELFFSTLRTEILS
jgi:hypothetical protein